MEKKKCSRLTNLFYKSTEFYNVVMLCSLNGRGGCRTIVNFHLKVNLLVILKRDQQNTVDILVSINVLKERFC